MVCLFVQDYLRTNAVLSALLCIIIILLTLQLELPDPMTTDNLATMSDLTEEILLKFLGQRYSKDQIYVRATPSFNYGIHLMTVCCLFVCFCLSVCSDVHWRDRGSSESFQATSFLYHTG